MLRRLLVIGLFMVVPAVGAFAQETPGSVDVVVVTGPMDHRTVDFVVAAITGTDADLVVLQMDVAAVLGGDVDGLVALVADPPVPVAVWVGPDPAEARGAAVRVLAAASLRGAAPGAVLGPAAPPIAGSSGTVTGVPAPVVDSEVVVESPVPGLAELVEPSIGQFVVGLHGRTVTIGGQEVVLDTARVEVVDGVERLSPSIRVRFVSEGIVDRVLHTAARPEAAFFFLLVGLAFAVFEFYAAGPGLAAAVAAGCLLLSGYGISVLPVWWPAIALSVVGVGAAVMDFQRNDLGWRSLLATGSLIVAGLRFVDGGEHLTAVWWVVLLTVTGTMLFLTFALGTVVRARFSTDTIGRDHLVGRRGVAVGAVEGSGEVEVDGVRWSARSSRRSGIAAGTPVVVTRIDGIVLEVDPA